MTDALPCSARRATGCLASLLILSFTACGGDADGSAWTTTVDTLDNGAVLVRHTPPPDPAPTWWLEPELRIGAVDGAGPEVFGRIADVAVTADGRIVVLDAQAQEIRVFARDGRYLTTLAREGAGPGEIRGASGLVLGPDGLIRVPDVRNGRLSFLDPDAGIVRSHPYHPSVGWAYWNGVVDAEGRSWAEHYYRDRTDGTTHYVYIAHGPDGTPSDTLPQPALGSVDGSRPGYWDVTAPGGASLTLAVPYYPHASYALSPAPQLWTTPDGDPAYRLTRWGAATDTTMILEVARPPVQTPTAKADSLVSALDERLDVRLDRSDIPAVRPAIESLFFDDEGRLWVHAVTPDDSLRIYDAPDTDTGAWLGTLATSIRLRDRPSPTIHGNTLWGVMVDEMDVPFVVRGRLVEWEASVHRAGSMR